MIEKNSKSYTTSTHVSANQRRRAAALTNHEQRHGEVFATGGLERAEHGADDGAAEADEGDHHDEPADRDGLGDHQAAAGLGVLLLGAVRQSAETGGGGGGSDTNRNTGRVGQNEAGVRKRGTGFGARSGSSPTGA